MPHTIPELYDLAFECHRRANGSSDPYNRNEWGNLSRRYIWIALNSVELDTDLKLPEFAKLKQ